jgi:hypothetical protein
VAPPFATAADWLQFQPNRAKQDHAGGNSRMPPRRPSSHLWGFKHVPHPQSVERHRLCGADSARSYMQTIRLCRGTHFGHVKFGLIQYTANSLKMSHMVSATAVTQSDGNLIFITMCIYVRILSCTLGPCQLSASSVHFIFGLQSDLSVHCCAVNKKEQPTYEYEMSTNTNCD